MSGQSTNGGANDSSERQYYPQPPLVICPRPAAPVYFLPPPGQTGRPGCLFSYQAGSLTHSYAFQGPSAAGAFEPAAGNTSAATQLASSSNEATATNTAAAAGTVTANAPPKRLSVMHQKLWDLKLKQDAKDPEAAARSRAARIQRRKEREIWKAEIKAEQERLEASKAADAARTDNTETVTANAPPKRLSVMHQKIWELKQKQDAKDPEAAARSRAARNQRRKEQAIWDAKIKAEQEKVKASKAAATENTNTDTTNAAASQSSTENRVLPAWYYDEREWNKKWWETHPDRCT